jgi:hypothetical protein
MTQRVRRNLILLRPQRKVGAWSALRPTMLAMLCGTLQKIYGLVVDSKGGNRYDIRSKLSCVRDDDDNSE